MKKSKLRNIIKEIIRQEVPRSTGKGYLGGFCRSKKPCGLRHENCFRVCSFHGPARCTYDDDCKEHCWCDH